MKIFHFFAYNLFALSQLFALNFNDVNNTALSPLGQRFQVARAKYIRLLDSFISAYGEGNGGKFPSYSFTAEQFARYHNQYMIDFLSKEKSNTFRNFSGLVVDINIPLEIGSPILWKYFVKDMIIDMYILEAYNMFIEYGDVINKTVNFTEKEEQFKLMLQEQETAQSIAEYLEAENILTLWCEDFLFLMVYGGEYSVDGNPPKN